MLSYLKSPVKNVKKYQPVNGLKDLFVNVASFFMNLKFDRASLFFAAAKLQLSSASCRAAL